MGRDIQCLKEIFMSDTASPTIRKSPWQALAAYRAAEICQVPMYVAFNTIGGRLWTVMKPGQFGNYSKLWEIFRRVGLAVMLIPTALVGVLGAVVALGFNWVGDYFLGDQPFVRLEGNYRHRNRGKSFATFNMATLLPNMTLSDGVSYSNRRLKKTAKNIKEYQFVCGQEVDGASARFFAKQMKESFAEFYTYIGKSNGPLIPSGLFFASKEKVRKVKVIAFTVPGVQTTIKRVLVIFELEKYAVAMMHLDSGSGKNLAEIHKAEIIEAKKELAKCTKDYIWCGDFNEDRRKPTEAYEELRKTHVDCLTEKMPITCTDKLEKERFKKPGGAEESSIDYITYPIGQKTTATASVIQLPGLSDHRLVQGLLHFV